MPQRARLPAIGADVSDLMRPAGVPAIGEDVTALFAPVEPRPRVPRVEAAGGRVEVPFNAPRLVQSSPLTTRGVTPRRAAARATDIELPAEIGRASCRERV